MMHRFDLQFEVQLEYTGAKKLLSVFTKSFANFAQETRIIAKSETNVIAALGQKFGARLIQTDDYDPDNAGFIKFAHWILIVHCC